MTTRMRAFARAAAATATTWGIAIGIGMSTVGLALYAVLAGGKFSVSQLVEGASVFGVYGAVSGAMGGFIAATLLATRARGEHVDSLPPRWIAALGAGASASFTLARGALNPEWMLNRPGAFAFMLGVSAIPGAVVAYTWLRLAQRQQETSRHAPLSINNPPPTTNESRIPTPHSTHNPNSPAHHARHPTNPNRYFG